MTWKAQIRSKVIETILQYQIFLFLLVIYYGFWPKYGSKSLSFHYFGSHLMSSLWRCLYLYRHELFSQTCIYIILFRTKICQDWMSSSWLEIRSTFQIFKIHIIPLFWQIFDDVTVTLSLVVLSQSFVKNSPLYYLTPHKILFRFLWSEK